jgi:integrase
VEPERHPLSFQAAPGQSAEAPGRASPERRHEIPDLTGLSAYVLRHTYAKEALGNGLSGPVVASLLGHKSTKMIDEHYSHLDQQGELLKEAARRATGRG